VREMSWLLNNCDGWFNGGICGLLGSMVSIYFSFDDVFWRLLPFFMYDEGCSIFPDETEELFGDHLIFKVKKIVRNFLIRQRHLKWWMSVTTLSWLIFFLNHYQRDLIYHVSVCLFSPFVNNYSLLIIVEIIV